MIHPGLSHCAKIDQKIPSGHFIWPDGQRIETIKRFNWHLSLAGIHSSDTELSPKIWSVPEWQGLENRSQISAHAFANCPLRNPSPNWSSRSDLGKLGEYETFWNPFRNVCLAHFGIFAVWRKARKSWASESDGQASRSSGALEWAISRETEIAHRFPQNRKNSEKGLVVFRFELRCSNNRDTVMHAQDYPSLYSSRWHCVLLPANIVGVPEYCWQSAIFLVSCRTISAGIFGIEATKLIQIGVRELQMRGC